MYRRFLDGEISEEEYQQYLHERKADDKRASEQFKKLVKEMTKAKMYEQMNFPETPYEFIKQYEFSDTKYRHIGKLIPVFRVETMLAHYIPELLKEKDETINNLIELLKEFDCDWMCDEVTSIKNGDWCEAHCEEECPKKECFLQYIKLKNGELKYE